MAAGRQGMDQVARTSAPIAGQAAAVSMGMTDLVMAQTIGLVMQNAVTAQRGMQQIAQASVAVTSALIVVKGLSG